ncbi:DNA-binding transcriptional response regulator [Winogradskyella tangerina]|uniref:hypothetical protein n=1 Tax=Winogradskyella tangerina TaxID=2023240 RepID=UPI000DBE1734|nr:hypothetical protein [Winogradskyella tangerina]
MNIYIVDDEIDLDFNKALLEDLEDLGHSIFIETSLQKAYHHLTDESNRFKYDFVLVDENFNGKFIYQKKNITNGADLCRHLCELDYTTPLILHTGISNSADKIKEVLGDYGICYFFEKTEFKRDIEKNILKLTKLPGFKRLVKIKQLVLREKIEDYFLTSKHEDLYKFQEEALELGMADWSRQDLKLEIDNGVYKVSDLLYNPEWGDDANLKISEMISAIFNRSQELNLFTKAFRTECKVQLEQYFSLSSVKKAELELKISDAATDYYLNLLLIYNKIESSNKIQDLNLSKIILNKRNRLLSATKKCNSENISTRELWQNFIDKLILRRVLLLCHVELELEDTKNFDEIQLYFILRDGHLKKYFPDKSKTLKKPVSSTGLGLSDNCIRRYSGNEGYILNEEREWYKSNKKRLKDLRRFLDKLVIKDDLINDIPYLKNTDHLDSEEEWTDYSHFEQSVRDVKSNINPAEFQRLLKYLKRAKSDYSFSDSFLAF